MLLLEAVQDFDVAGEEEFFAALPARPGVFLLETRVGGAQPYLARTSDLRRASERLLRPPEPGSRRLSLREVAARVRYRVTGSKFEQSLTLYLCAREHFPRRYRDLLRLRPPAMLKVNLRNEYPRCYVTRRISPDRGFYFGPFPSRKAAEAFAENFLDLFKIRRCQIKIRRDPTFPGCIYSEMKMCLAPCFAGCSKEEYDAELSRVLATLSTDGAALTAELEQAREVSSEAGDYERAAAIHKRLEKASLVLRGLPDLARRIDELDAVILQRASEENSVAVFVVRGGIIADPFLLRFGEISSQPRSVEEILREHMESFDPPAGAPVASRTPPKGADIEATIGAPETGHIPDVYRARFGLYSAPSELAEHLALLSRWFQSNPREGEIFFRERDWPYRRLIRACSRVMNPRESAPRPPIAKPPAGSA